MGPTPTQKQWQGQAEGGASIAPASFVAEPLEMKRCRRRPSKLVGERYVAPGESSVVFSVAASQWLIEMRLDI